MGIGALALSVGAGALVFAPSAARAGSCSDTQEWDVAQGTLATTGTCGSFLGATDGANAVFSYALFFRKRPVTIPYEVSLSMRRLGPEDKRSLEVSILSAIVLARDEEVGLYVNHDDVRFEHEGWFPAPGLAMHREHRLTVRQTRNKVTLSIDGAVVRTWDFASPSTTDRVGVAWKGASGFRSWAAFRDVRVTPL
jgi:hypothetical protein